MPGFITSELPEPTEKPPKDILRKAIVTVLAIGALLVVAPTATAGISGADPTKVSPCPGWEVD